MFDASRSEDAPSAGQAPVGDLPTSPAAQTLRKHLTILHFAVLAEVVLSGGALLYFLIWSLTPGAGVMFYAVLGLLPVVGVVTTQFVLIRAFAKSVTTDLSSYQRFLTIGLVTNVLTANVPIVLIDLVLIGLTFRVPLAGNAEGVSAPTVGASKNGVATITSFVLVVLLVGLAGYTAYGWWYDCKPLVVDRAASGAAVLTYTREALGHVSFIQLCHFSKVVQLDGQGRILSVVRSAARDIMNQAPPSQPLTVKSSDTHDSFSFDPLAGSATSTVLHHTAPDGARNTVITIDHPPVVSTYGSSSVSPTIVAAWLSPDAHHVLYETSNPHDFPTTQFWLVDVAGRSEKQLTGLGGANFVTWDLADKYLVFWKSTQSPSSSSTDPGAPRQLFTASLSDGTVTSGPVLPVPPIPNGDGSPGLMTPTADQRGLVYLAAGKTDNSYQVVTVNFSTLKTTAAPLAYVVDSFGQKLLWTADGSQLLTLIGDRSSGVETFSLIDPTTGIVSPVQGGALPATMNSTAYWWLGDHTIAFIEVGNFGTSYSTSNRLWGINTQSGRRWVIDHAWGILPTLNSSSVK